MQHLFDRDFHHQRAILATMEAAEPAAKSSMGDIVKAARAINLPWDKIFKAVMTAAAGGFSPAAIAAAIAILFGSTPPASLAAMASAS